MKDHTFKEKIDILKQSLPMLGPLMSLRYVLIHLLGYSPGKDQSFDARYGTDTTGLISSRQLAINDPTSRANAIVYLPAPEGVTRCMRFYARAQYAGQAEASGNHHLTNSLMIDD